MVDQKKSWGPARQFGGEENQEGLSDWRSRQTSVGYVRAVAQLTETEAAQLVESLAQMVCDQATHRRDADLTSLVDHVKSRVPSTVGHLTILGIVETVVLHVQQLN